MGEFDFVKFTLILAVVLIVLTGGGYFYMTQQLDDTTMALNTANLRLKAIGEASGNITTLESALAEDRMRRYEDTPYSYFYEMSQATGLERAYNLSAGKEEVDRMGFKDTEFVLDFRSNKKVSRDRLTNFIWHVEANSPRIKLVQARLQLDSKESEQNLWKANLTFLKRDPHAADKER